ncbi:L,D-transpeptidase family protein [Beggiatoa leptomitoformis]|uniref:L,D-transpeptidase family protein n=2 Tax=Beggiatoa leptomitoformis TaxID=288004 RepID=A0A2N9YJ79_9GAMM|nr:L,D-transpeptidase family protein [Beggiatoa leptomitoformis]AUI70544.1 L,D-transpeptidase family protein [Beggiatoa leptomitoformis]
MNETKMANNTENRISPEIIEKLQIAIQEKGLTWGTPIFIRIFKQEKQLEVWLEKNNEFVLFKTYPICTYSGELGSKKREGDKQSPEGFYFVTPAQMNPNSQYHLAFNLGFPNDYDRAKKWTGSALMVHGGCVSIGCYAMTDPFIEEIYTLADVALQKGQSFFRVHIFPFRMTEENLQSHANSVWSAFWLNLKAGYDFFEQYQRPPNVKVKNSLYIFEAS